jgi:hypothetical protein
LIAAAALAAFAAPASAKHIWFKVDYATGICDVSHYSPEETYNMAFAFGGLAGVHLDLISPDHVTKDAARVIRVHLTGTRNGSQFCMDFFTSIYACVDFIKSNSSIKAQQAPDSDIN